ncbi:hypothetical protein [Streptomyces sp. NPDC003077]|uniref:hypothetical protein n=1 Tax=Streptomyces sp. NPDC003077 TaxID=3154443 RepID=UPI0033BE3118
MKLGITGHRGLPPRVADRVRAELNEAISRYGASALVGVSCLADGPDTWFAQAVLAHGGRIEVVVPADEYRDGLPDWHHAAYDELMERASRVHRTGLADSDSHAHMEGSKLLVGMVDELLAVWDGLPARGYGGTADVVAYAKDVNVATRVLWPVGARRD